MKALDPRARQRLLALVADLIQSDRQFTVFEFIVQQILADHLGDAAGRAVPVRYYTFAAVAVPLRVLLSVLARAGASDEQAAAGVYARAFAPFALGPATLLPESEGSLSALGPALGELAALSPLLKQNVIHACGDSVSSDGLVTAVEAELLQAVALTLDCPLPFNGDALQ